MPIKEPSDNLALAEVFRAPNELAVTRLVEDWALGAALVAIFTPASLWVTCTATSSGYHVTRSSLNSTR